MQFVFIILLAAGLPGFEEFKTADRERRETGKWETAESAALLRVDTGKVMELAAKQPGDAFLQWGAAELLVDWTNRHARFEAALAASGTNEMIALRYGCAAAKEGKYDLALGLLRICQQRDASNAVPWLVEAWIQQQRATGWEQFKPAAEATVYADASAGAARVRIRFLEAMGYSPYAARRIGYTPELTAVPMLRDIARQEQISPSWLRQVARSMQQSPTFLVIELVGQSMENLLGASADRVADLKERREELTELTKEVGQRVVNQATEAELVRYYDDMLAFGEEAALQRLKRAVQAGRGPR